MNATTVPQMYIDSNSPYSHVFIMCDYILNSHSDTYNISNYKIILNNLSDQNKNEAHIQPCWGKYITNVTRGMESSKQRHNNCRYVSENKTRRGHKNHRWKSSVNVGAGLHLRCDCNLFHPVEMQCETDTYFRWLWNPAEDNVHRRCVITVLWFN